MEFWLWVAIFVLFIMLMSAKSDINRVEWRINELTKCLKIKPAEEKAETSPILPQIQIPPVSTAPRPTADALPQPEPQLPQPVEAPAPRKAEEATDNVTFLGQKLITWIAGFAAILGFFYFVRYSIENGLLGPTARMTLTAVGGLALCGAGCLLYHKKHIANHQRIGEALSGAGIAALYFAAYASSRIYHLMPESASFVLMCLTTAGAIALTLLAGGQTTAILALIGGFLTPALTAGSGGIAGFCAYLFVLTVALLFTSRRLGTIVPALLALFAFYSWIGIYLLLYFALNDSFALFALTALTAAATTVIFRDNQAAINNSELLKNIAQLFCIIFTFVYLLKTDFGIQEWSTLAVMLCGLTVLCLFRRQLYFKLLAAAQFTTFVLLALWDSGDMQEKQIFYGVFAAIALLPFYIAAWVRPHREFVLFPAAAAPVVYALAYFLFPDGRALLPYIGLAAAVLLAVLVCRLNLKDKSQAAAGSFLLLAAAALTTMALASLVNVDFWPIVLSAEILILGFLHTRLGLNTLSGGIKLGALLFAATEYKNVSLVCRLLLSAPLTPVEFFASRLTQEYYISYIIVPLLAFAALTFAIRGRGRIFAAAAAVLLAFLGLFSFYMLVKMQFAGKISLLPTFADYTLITNLLLLGTLTYAYKNLSFFKTVFAIGCWRLIGIGLLCCSPFFNRVDVSVAGVLSAYGIPTVLFAFCAFKTNGSIRDNFVRGAAVMSFILVSAVLTLAFYSKLYLTDIDFDNGSIFAYSAAWLVLGCIWLTVAFRCRALVKPAFGLIYFVIAKVFLYDVSSLDGIWRISALFGLAGSLLAISYCYSRWFQPKNENA